MSVIAPEHRVGPPAELPAAYPELRAVVDFAIAAVLLAATGPLILVLMALVKLTSRGPALYWQARLGQDGAVYTIYKLRTMERDCERTSGAVWSTMGDPRVTPLGRLLRKTHLDELPQLWNVLRGEMSLIGPRPERPEFVNELERLYPTYRRRLAVRPGITGLAQVQLPADTDMPGVGAKLACDLCYIANMGPLLDLRILAGTALKVLGLPLEAIRATLALPTSEPILPVGDEVRADAEDGADDQDGPPSAGPAGLEVIVAGPVAADMVEVG